MGVFIPVAIVAATVTTQLLSERSQARQDFELKAAEIVMAEQGPRATYNKARALKALFKSRLPSEFAVRFDPQDFQGDESDAIVSAKKELIKLVAITRIKGPLVIALWRAAFPGDAWVPALNEVVSTR